MWPRFLAARRADARLAASSDPIEHYVERACAGFTQCWFAHREYDGAFLPFQRIAAAAGFGWLAETNLLIHPTYGPWFALRAIVLTTDPPVVRALPAPACDCGTRCASAFARAREVHSTWREWLAARDACCVGREHRYDDDQIEYHYTKRLALLP